MQEWEGIDWDWVREGSALLPCFVLKVLMFFISSQFRETPWPHR